MLTIKKDKIIGIRVDSDTFESLQKLAKNRNLSLSEYCRFLCTVEVQRDKVLSKVGQLSLDFDSMGISDSEATDLYTFVKQTKEELSLTFTTLSQYLKIFDETCKRIENQMVHIINSESEKLQSDIKKIRSTKSENTRIDTSN